MIFHDPQFIIEFMPTDNTLYKLLCVFRIGEFTHVGGDIGPQNPKDDLVGALQYAVTRSPIELASDFQRFRKSFANDRLGFANAIELRNIGQRASNVPKDLQHIRSGAEIIPESRTDPG